MKPMLPTLTFHIPTGPEWIFEPKMDGFRTILKIDQTLEMISRNGKDLLFQFPEAQTFFKLEKEKLKAYTPIIFDGELVILENEWRCDFQNLQIRGKLRSKEKIEKASKRNPVHLMVFDLLMIKGKAIHHEPYEKRKKILEKLFKTFKWPLKPTPLSEQFLQFLPGEKKFSDLWKNIRTYGGEGIVAKLKSGKWEEGKRTTEWLKFKNWRKAHCFITKLEKRNGFFHLGVYDGQKVVPVGLFKHGLEKEEYEALVKVLKTTAIKEDEVFLYVEPALCVEINCLAFFNGVLREPFFSRFLFDQDPKGCTLVNLELRCAPVPVEISHPEKPLWPEKGITKADYIYYLKKVFPYMIPFLRNRSLTVIRYPHGILGEAFFQKNCPDYAPDFVETFEEDGINAIVTNSLETLLWLGNQLAIEFHIPFSTVANPNPVEIVIDLDPPTKREFPWAKEAAQIIYDDILKPLGLIGFIKVSGKRGIQIHIPLIENTYVSWEDCRRFTAFVAEYLLSKHPNHFTTERMKQSRGHKLYIDYIQHAKGKTIICPYSLRGNPSAGVAAPIYWEELETIEKADQFSMQDVLDRLKNQGDPFQAYFSVKNIPSFLEILNFLKGKQ